MSSKTILSLIMENKQANVAGGKPALINPDYM